MSSEDKLIHLDPHYCQEMVDVNQENFSPHSFHCKSPRKLKLSKLDPSCCIGFYCATRADFDNFVASVQPVRHNPIFTFMKYFQLFRSTSISTFCPHAFLPPQRRAVRPSRRLPCPANTPPIQCSCFRDREAPTIRPRIRHKVFTKS